MLRASFGIPWDLAVQAKPKPGPLVSSVSAWASHVEGLHMLFGGSVRPCVVPDWVVGLSVHSENIGRTWVQTTKEYGGHQL